MQTDRNALTEGVIWKKLLFFALPILLGNIFQQMYNTADALIVGRFLDEAALAAKALPWFSISCYQYSTSESK